MSYEAWGDGDEQFDTWAETASEHGWYSPDDLSRAEKDVILERARQVDIEGFDHVHDDRLIGGELSLCASTYAVWSLDDDYKQDGPPKHVPDCWGFYPEDPASFKPKDRRRDLVRAAALLIAEIERLDRAQQSTAAAKE